MSLQDPISDLLTCIRNGQSSNKILVSVPFSKIKESIVKILIHEGYLKSYKINGHKKLTLELTLKYFRGKSVIETIKRISKPSLRQYKKSCELPKILGGLGIAVLSTSQGIMTDHTARKRNIGGEVICYVE